MSVDLLGRRAADALRSETAALDVEAGLASLHRLDRQRSLRRGVGAFATVTVLALVALVLAWPSGRPGSEPPRPVRPVAPDRAFPELGDGYDVLAAVVSPSGRLQAIATLRDGKSAVVLVRRAGEAQQDFVWSAQTPQELADENESRAVSVAWGPDEQELALLIAQVPFGEATSRAELTLLTMNADGTDRRRITADIGSCTCDAALPTLTWSPDSGSVEVDVPDDTGPGHYDVALP